MRRYREDIDKPSYLWYAVYGHTWFEDIGFEDIGFDNNLIIWYMVWKGAMLIVLYKPGYIKPGYLKPGYPKPVYPCILICSILPIPILESYSCLILSCTVTGFTAW